MVAKRKNNGITTREKNFVRYYINSPNATKAYMKAFDTTNRESAGVLGSNLLKKVRVREFLESERIAFWTPQLASREEVIMLLTRAARGELLEDNYVVRKMGRDEPDEIEVVKRVPRSVQKGAMDSLAKIHGLFNDNQTLVTVGVVIEDDISSRLKSRDE